MLPVTSLSSSGFLMTSMSAKNSSSSLVDTSLLHEVAFDPGILDGVEDDDQVVRIGNRFVPDRRSLTEECPPRKVQTYIHEYDHVELL